MPNPGDLSGVVVETNGNAGIIRGVIIDSSGGISAASDGASAANNANVLFDPRPFDDVSPASTAGVVQNTWLEIVKDLSSLRLASAPMETAVEILFAATLGAVAGSFLNVVAWRLPRRESLVSPRSRCPECETQIAAYDNVPVLSWLALRGRCRHCGAHIAARYPVVELVTAATFTAVVAVRGFDDELLLELPCAAMLIAVATIDLEHRIVPNRIVAPAAAWALVAAVVAAPSELPELLLAGAAAFLGLLLAALAYPAGMGMGDVKLAGVMGLYLGVAVAPALLAAFAVGALVGVAMMMREGAGARKRGVPFAPFLALGGLLGLLAGPELVDLYADNFLS